MSNGDAQPSHDVDAAPVTGGHRTDHAVAGDRDLADVLAFPSLGRRDRQAPAEVSEPLLRDVIGAVLRRERHDQGRTLADVANEAAVSLPYLSEVERGVKEVSSDVLISIGDALDLPLVAILERSVERLHARSQRGSGIQLRAA